MAVGSPASVLYGGPASVLYGGPASVLYGGPGTLSYGGPGPVSHGSPLVAADDTDQDRLRASIKEAARRLVAK